MTEKLTWLAVGAAIGAIIGIGASYLAMREAPRKLEKSPHAALTATMPPDMKTAWGNYLEAARK